MHKKKTRDNKNELTNRENEVLALLVEGCSPVEIGRVLNLSIHTVTAYKKRILIKTRIKNLALLTKYYSDSKQFVTSFLKTTKPISRVDKNHTEQPKQTEIMSEQVFREGLSYQEHLDNYSYNLLLQGLGACNNSVHLLSQKLQMPERTLYRLIKKFGLKPNSSK